MFVAGGDDNLVTAINRCLATSETFRVDVELRGQASRRFISLVVQPARTRGSPVTSCWRWSVTATRSTRSPSGFRRCSTRPAAPRRDDLRARLRSHRLRYLDGALARRLGLSGAPMLFEDFAARVHPDDLLEHPAYEATRDGSATTSSSPRPSACATWTANGG